MCICIVKASDPLNTKLTSHRPPITQQNFGSGHDRSSDRLASSSKHTSASPSSSSATVGGGNGGFTRLSQCLVKFVWYPSDPSKIHDEKATLLSFFTVSYFDVLLYS